MTDELLAEIQALLEAAAATPGAAVDADLRSITRSLSLFTSNAAELRVQLDEEQRFETWSKLGPGNQAEFERHLDEIDRLLHNFLAAAYTPASHTIRIRDRYPDEDLDETYAENSPFVEPVCQLVQELRNDAQHAHLPSIRQQIEYTSEPSATLTCRLVIDRSYLGNLSLNAKTRDYALDVANDLDLDSLVDSYTGLVETFVGWFVGAVVEMRVSDLAETLALRQRAHDLAEPLRRSYDQP